MTIYGKHPELQILFLLKKLHTFVRVSHKSSSQDYIFTILGDWQASIVAVTLWR